jgi:hypothetical protein
MISRPESSCRHHAGKGRVISDGSSFPAGEGRFVDEAGYLRRSSAKADAGKFRPLPPA